MQPLSHYFAILTMLANLPYVTIRLLTLLYITLSLSLFFLFLHGWRDSNSQPMVLETTTLPIELHPFIQQNRKAKITFLNLLIKLCYYSIIEVICPAPTVLPPSLIANRNPSLIATPFINSTVIVKLSPGITISTPSGRKISPVTSVVLI